jgi:hypothetical protein
MMRPSFAQPVVQAAAYFQPLSVPKTVTQQAASSDRSLNRARLLDRGRAALQGRVSPHSSVGASAPVVAAQTQPDVARQILSNPVPGQNAAMTATELLLYTNAVAAEQMQFVHPTVVFFQAQYVETDEAPGSDSQPHYTIWRVQIWRVTVVSPMWKRVPQIPVAHST